MIFFIPALLNGIFGKLYDNEPKVEHYSHIASNIAGSIKTTTKLSF